MKSLGIGRGNNILENLLFLLFYTKVQSTVVTTQINETRMDQIDRQTSPASPQGSPESPQKVWKGKISIYSATYGGCLYCKKYFDENGQLYYIRADGSRLVDDNGIAFNHLPLGTRVSLVAFNGKSTGAVVKDTGGFESPEYGRIADLTPSLADALGVKTDNIIEISKVP